MKFTELKTSMVKSVSPDTYWGGIGQLVASDCWDAFIAGLIELTADKLRELLPDYTISNPKLFSPREYNFSGDELIFDLEMTDDQYSDLVWLADDAFFRYAYEEYRSRDGFISFMPYTRERFAQALKSTGYDRTRAVQMLLSYKLSRDFDIDGEAERFDWEIEDMICENGWADYGCDELEAA